MSKADFVIEMPKESDSFNTDDNNSKMMIIPPTAHVEEVVLSDEEQTETYEEKLNKKLTDLDLFEEGMTIQQKEELLAVVIASWETAKEEKTRRQFYQDYMQASEAFCSDEQIEFTFQECPDPTTQDLSTTEDMKNDSHENGEFSGASGIVRNAALGSSSQGHESEKNSIEACHDSQIFSLRNLRLRGRPSRSRGRPRKVRCEPKPSTSSSGMVAARYESCPGETNETKENLEKESASSRLFDEEVKHHSLEESMSSWKPCLSPKETPLSCSKKPWLNEEEEVFGDPVEECAKLVNSFSIARRETQKHQPPDRTLVKAYHLTRRGHFSKKSTRPDKYDIMIGVPAKMTSVQSLPEIDAKDVLSRTSSGAFRCITSTNKSSSLSEYEPLTTRSGVKYGFYNQAQTESVQPLELSTPGTVHWPPKSPSPLFSDVEVILDEKLPAFNHLRPIICGDSFSESGNKSNCDGNCADTMYDRCEEGGNHMANVDNDSSEASSVIDVETIVDDEIEEFVSKRKLLQELHGSSKESNSSHRKRLKKSTT